MSDLTSPWSAPPVDLLSLSENDVLTHCAVHEAGHAVVGLRVGLLPQVVKVGGGNVLTSGGLVAGGTQFTAPAGDHFLLAKERPEDMAVALLAGISAEQLLLGRYGSEGWVEDMRILRVGLRWLDAGVDEARRAKLDELLRLSHEAVQQDENAIRVVADALLQRRTLTAQQLAGLV